MLQNLNTSEAENIAEIEDERPELDQEFQTMLLDLSEILDNTTDIQNSSNMSNSSDTHLSETEINGILNEVENSTQENLVEINDSFDQITTSTTFTSGTSTTSRPSVAVLPTTNGSDAAVATTAVTTETTTQTTATVTEYTPEIKQKIGENPVEIDSSPSTVLTTAATTYVTGRRGIFGQK